jgi:hypothetical protein
VHAIVHSLAVSIPVPGSFSFSEKIGPVVEGTGSDFFWQLMLMLRLNQDKSSTVSLQCQCSTERSDTSRMNEASEQKEE